MIVELACQKLGLDKMDNISLPEKIKCWRNEKREWLQNLLEPVVETIYTDYNKPVMDGVNMRIVTQKDAFDIIAPAHLRGKHLEMLINGR